MPKPLHIFKAALSGRYYASRSVKQLSHMHMVCTGQKEDVTEQVEALIAAATPAPTQRSGEVEEALAIMDRQWCGYNTAKAVIRAATQLEATTPAPLREALEALLARKRKKAEEYVGKYGPFDSNLESSDFGNADDFAEWCSNRARYRDMLSVISELESVAATPQPRETDLREALTKLADAVDQDYITLDSKAMLALIEARSALNPKEDSK